MRKLSEIAKDILLNWKTINLVAKEYAAAMLTLSSVDDKYYMESGDDIVLRFLANAQTWRGDKAKEIKMELKQLLKN